MAKDRYLQSYVPHISKESFDDEAAAFLGKYYPEALATPMVIPIEKIAKEKLGLTIQEERNTEE